MTISKNLLQRKQLKRPQQGGRRELPRQRQPRVEERTSPYVIFSFFFVEFANNELTPRSQSTSDDDEDDNDDISEAEADEERAPPTKKTSRAAILR